MALIPGNLIQLLLNMQVLNGFIAPVVLTFILILANRRNVLGNAVNGPRFRILATVCVVVVAILASVVFVQTVAGLARLRLIARGPGGPSSTRNREPARCVPTLRSPNTSAPGNGWSVSDIRSTAG